MSASQLAAAKLSGGSAAAQIVGLAVSPVLTRLFDPVQFGALATFTALTAWIVTVATGKYEMAVMLPEEERTAVELALAGLVLASVSAVLTLLGVVFWLVLVRDSETDYSFLWWLPLMVLVTSFNAVLVAFANRRGDFGLVAATTVTKGVVTAIAQVLGGLFRPTAPVLVGASVLGAGAANVRLTRDFLAARRASAASWNGVYPSAREYRRFPIHTLPASVLSATTLNALPIVIGAMFGAATLGLWSLAQRAVSAPLLLIGSSISQVYYRRAVETHRTGGDSMALLTRTTLQLAILSLPAFVLVGLFAPPLFGFVFGSEWETAGQYARIMLPWLWVRFVSSPISQTPLVFHRNRLGLLIQVGLFTTLTAACLAAWLTGLDFAQFLTLLSCLMTANYAVAVALYRGVVKRGTHGEPLREGHDPSRGGGERPSSA